VVPQGTPGYVLTGRRAGDVVFDAGCSAWDSKRAFDSVRPITAIRMLFRGRPVGL
jgi:hypothetical protein